MTDAALLQRRYERERKARKEAESLLEGKSRELYAANQELSGALEESQLAQVQLIQSEKMASVGQLAAGVAHEINNPIGFVSSNLNSLQQYVGDLKRVVEAAQALHVAAAAGAPDAAASFEAVCAEVDLDFVLEDLDGLIDESLEGTNRVRTIVADLRDFSHVDAPELVLADVNLLIEKTLTVARNEIKYSADIVKELGALPEIPCHGGQLGQVLLNLLVNATQAIDGQGTITVRTGHDVDVVWIEVQDTGCGIPEDIRTRIFDPFFTTKPVGSGTGLGLHLTAKIVDSHGGRISVTSEVGRGSTFRVELPVSGPPATNEESETRDAA